MASNNNNAANNIREKRDVASISAKIGIPASELDQN